MVEAAKPRMSFRWKIFAAVLFGMLLAQAAMSLLDLNSGLSIGVMVGVAVAVTLILSKTEKQRVS